MTANVTEHPIDPSGAKIAGAAIDLSNNNIKSEANQMAAIPQPSIFVLNNDCIEMVLILLPLSDLVAIAETCTQTQQIKNRTLVILQTPQKFESGSLRWGTTCWHPHITSQNFGDFRQFNSQTPRRL